MMQVCVSMFSSDEALARRLQDEEDNARGAQQEANNPSRLLREAKKAALMEVSEPIGPIHPIHAYNSRNLRKKGACNLMDIMEEERANQQRREEQVGFFQGSWLDEIVCNLYLM